MNSYEDDLKDLEKYTFSKHLNTNNYHERVSQINSYTNNFILNYQPLNNINDKAHNNNTKIFQKLNDNNVCKEEEKDINYNELNIVSHQKSPLKYNNINNINNLNIISFYKNNKIRNYNHLNNINANKINNINAINNDLFKINSISKYKVGCKRKFKTPDKNMNYNDFNHKTPNHYERRNRLYNNEPQNISDKNIQIYNKINYNESFRIKKNNRNIRKALTPDNTNIRNVRNFKNVKKNINNIPINCNYNNLNLKQVNISNSNNNSDINKKINDLYRDIHLNYNNLSLGNSGYQNIINNKFKNNNSNIIRYNYYKQKLNINKINTNYNNSHNSSMNSIMSKNNEYIKYSESCFNTRLPRGAKLPILNKNILRSVSCNKTPSPIRKNNTFLSNSFYNSKNKKLLKYTRSSSSDNFKENINKLRQIFKLKNTDSNYSPDSSLLNIYNKNLNNSCLSQYNFLNNGTYNKNSIYSSNFNNSSGYNSSSLYNNKNNSSYLNEKNYNMTQPEFNKPLYNLGNINDINKIFNKSECNIIDSKNNYFNSNNSNNEFKYKYSSSNNNDSQSYNYKSYIESYNNESIKENMNSNINNNNNWKSEISNNNISKINKYNFIYKNKKINLSIGNSIKNNNNYGTKLSTNNNTFDENSMNNNTSCYKDSKNNKMDTIEEVHLNLVSILQSTKNMVRTQENMATDKIIFNNTNSSVIIIEERDLE